MLTTFCIDKHRNWLLVGTSRGILDLWDLRFKIRLKSIGLPQAHRVNSICLHPAKGRGRWVCVASGTAGEVSVWDLEKSVCREVYRPHRAGHAKESTTYAPIEIDQSSPEEQLARFSHEISSASLSEESSRPLEVKAMTVGVEARDNRGDHAYLITTSTDLRLRFWDLQKIESSTIVLGADIDEEKTVFSSSMQSNIMVYAEDEPRQRKKKTGLTPVQHVRKNHMDTILSVAYLQWPYPMIVSADRSGVLKVTA